MDLAILLAFVPGSAAVAAFITGYHAWAVGLFVVFCVWSFVTGFVYSGKSDETNGAAQPAYELQLNPAMPCITPSIGRGTRVRITVSGTVSFHDMTTRYADACHTWTWNMNPGAYTRHTWLHFDDHDTSPTPFREERHLHRYDFCYDGRGRPLVINFNIPKYQHRQSSLDVSIRPLSAEDEALLNQAAAARTHEEKEECRRQHEAAEADRQRRAREAEDALRRINKVTEAKRRQEAEALEAQRRTRFRTIQARYSDQLFAWRNDPSALARYARDHQHALLNPRRQRDIINAYTDFHDDDLDFVEWMRTNHTDLWGRVDEIFYYRALALAESLATTHLDRPKLSPQEREAKFARYRERALERDRIQAEDRMAAVRQKLDLLQQFKDDLDTYDLDEDERDRLIKEFEDDLFAQPEENFDGNFKQV